MTFLSNFIHRIPTDGLHGGNAVVPRAITIPPSILNPERVADVDDVATPFFYIKNHRIEAPVNRPPVSVLNAMTCDEWQLDMAVSFGGAAITEAALSLTGTATTMGKKAGEDYFETISYSGSNTSGTESVSVSIDIGDLSMLAWGYDLGEWALPVRIRINAADTALAISSAYSIGTILPGSPTGTAYSGVDISFGPVGASNSQTIILYDGGNQDATPTGTLTLTPVSWLPLA